MKTFGRNVALSLVGLFGLTLTSCAERSVAADNPLESTKGTRMKEPAANVDVQQVSELPFSHGRSFATLDAYLDHLRRYAAPVGQPWYRRISADRFELVTTRVPPGPREVLTRSELMRQFGFDR